MSDMSAMQITAVPQSWVPLRGMDQRRLSEARLQAHNAVQWLARAARAYVPPLPDDAHTNLGWNDEADGFVTHPLRDGSRISLNIANLTLSLQHNGLVLPFILHGHTDPEVRDWLGTQLRARSLDAAALDQPAPYTVPERKPADDARYDAVDVAEGLTELAAWFANAHCSLEPIRA